MKGFVEVIKEVDLVSQSHHSGLLVAKFVEKNARICGEV